MRVELGDRDVLAALDPVQVGVDDADRADRGREAPATTVGGVGLACAAACEFTISPLRARRTDSG